MPLPVTSVVVGVANGNAFLPDILIAPFELSVGVVVTSGSVNYTLQYTYDDPQVSGGIVTWWNHPLMTTLTTQADVTLNGGPVTAVRLINNAAGTITGRFIQGGK